MAGQNGRVRAGNVGLDHVENLDCGSPPLGSDEHPAIPAPNASGPAPASMAGGGVFPPIHFDDLPEPDSAELAKSMLDTAVRDWGNPDDPLIKSHKILARFLFKRSWNGYVPRESSMITITVRPTGLSVTLKMPSEAQSVTVLVQQLHQVWDALEYCLRTHSGDWKELKNGPGAQKLREDRKKQLEIEKQKK